MRIIVSRDVLHHRYGACVGSVDNGLSYAVGLRALGHEVYLMADVEPERCVDAGSRPVAFSEWDGRRRFESVARAYGIWPRCCLIYDRGAETHGMPFDRAVEAARSADLLLVIGGRMRTPEILEGVRRRAYVDQNPAKTQVYYAEHGADYGFDAFDGFFTLGLNIGSADCEIPTGGLDWRPLLSPVVLDAWPVEPERRRGPFTTISTWEGKHTFRFRGRHSGEKADEWRRYIDLPCRTRQEMGIALPIDGAHARDAELLLAHGWRLYDPGRLRDRSDYRTFIARSRAEFSVANGRYVAFNTGWFSERSARYLASGRPVLVQSTGFERHLPTGLGLLSFVSIDDALSGIEEINTNYAAHCRAAREIAEEHFASDRVLGGLLERLALV